MKAIKVTQELKDNNPTLFGIVGSIYKGRLPKTFVRDEGVVLGYSKRYDLQVLDGWKDIEEPSIQENQRKGVLIETTEGFTYDVIDLTDEEIARRSEITMPRNTFKLSLLNNYGVKNSDVDALFAALIANELATELEVEEMKILWYESSVFKSTTPELFQFAATLSALNPTISITEAQLKQIFTNYANN